jgi:hypothetical protein
VGLRALGEGTGGAAQGGSILAAAAPRRQAHPRSEYGALFAHLQHPDRERGAGARGAAHLRRGGEQPAHENAVDEAALRVREGAPIGKSLAARKLFPPMMIHLIASGESSGELEKMLERAATNQEREMDGLLSTLTNLLGPLMVVFMGAVVMFIVIALLLPIFQLNDLVK